MLGVTVAVPLAVVGRIQEPEVGPFRAAAAGVRDAVIELQQVP